MIIIMLLCRSPGTTPKKTPVKFDLKASLKKGLSYKPHTGKLKPVESAYQKQGPQSKPRVALKEMKNVGLRYAIIFYVVTGRKVVSTLLCKCSPIVRHSSLEKGAETLFVHYCPLSELTSYSMTCKTFFDH